MNKESERGKHRLKCTGVINKWNTGARRKETKTGRHMRIQNKTGSNQKPKQWHVTLPVNVCWTVLNWRCTLLSKDTSIYISVRRDLLQGNKYLLMCTIKRRPILWTPPWGHCILGVIWYPPDGVDTLVAMLLIERREHTNYLSAHNFIWSLKLVYYHTWISYFVTRSKLCDILVFSVQFQFFFLLAVTVCSAWLDAHKLWVNGLYNRDFMQHVVSFFNK